MVERLLQYIKGYVTIRLMSSMPERFLNLCAHHGIILYDLQHHGGHYEMKMSIKDFFLLRPLCRKSHSKIIVIEKHGLPFFFNQHKKRKAFFLGILLCAVLVLVLSTRIWNIHIQGNYSNSTQVVLKFLESEDIVHGISKRKLDCSQIASDIRANFPDVTWVSAKIVGTRLMITIQENELQQAKAEESQEACDIISDKNGTIVKMITRSGVPQMQPGQVCRQGDLLVLGRLEIMNDSQELVRYEYVPSDADIYVETTYSYYQEFSMVHAKRNYTGNVKNRYFLQLGNWRLETGLFPSGFENYDRIGRSQQLRLTENFYLPVRYGSIADCEYAKQKTRYTEEEAKNIAQEKLTYFFQKLMEKGVDICENNVKISIANSICRSQGTIRVIEKTGTKQPTQRLAAPEERTLVDEQ